MREFIANHPLTNDTILVRKGETGYYKFPCSKDAQDRLNAVNNNTDTDLEIAVQCSMFGWDIPKAQELS